MNSYHEDAMLTDQLERQLIQQEIARQLSFSPVFNVRPLIDKVASLLGYARVEGSLVNPRASY